MLVFDAVGFTLFGIPGYFFFAGIGFVVSISVFIVFVVDKGYMLQRNMRNLLISMPFMIFCARLFGCISGVYRDVGMNIEISLEGIKNTGIVFYGGFIGLFSSLYFLTKKYNQDKHVLDIVAVCVPLFHSIARVGCFLGGCCFGKEYTGFFSIKYTTLILGEVSTANRIPTQIIEAVFNFCLFLYLLFLLKSNKWKDKHISKQYLLIYSIGRFFIEFLRGDIMRGVIYGISFSQVICVLIWVYLLISYYISRRYSKKMELKEDINL